MNTEWNYSRDDFVSSEAPYEAVYAYHNNQFRHKRMIEAMSAHAVSVGFRGFKSLYKAFVKEKQQQQTNGIVKLDGATEFTGQALELNTGEWEADDTGVRRRGQFGDDIACPHPIMPVERYVNIDTGEEKLRLAYRKGTHWRKAIVPKTVLASTNKVTELAGIGIAVTSQNARSFVQYISDMENLNYDLIPEKKSIGRLGYIEGEGFSPFVDQLIFDGDAAFASLFDSVHSKGSEQLWLGVARQVREESTTAKILLAASFASPLLDIVNSLPFFVHLWSSESGTGKTVALMLAASVWGDPAVGNYIKTFDSTAVGLEKTAAFLNHLPLCIDELQLSKDSNGKSKFDVYKLAQGVGRTRGNRAGGVDVTPVWRNCILTTGESPLTGEASGAGAVNRVIDIECKASNVVIRNGMYVANAVKRNYGWAGKRFVAELYKDEATQESVVRRFQELFKDLSDRGTTEKQAMAAAAVVLGDELACKWVLGGDPLTCDEIADFLASKAAVSVGARAYRSICDWISQNGHKLCKKSENSDVYGELDSGCAYIIRSVFERMLIDNGYSCAAVISYLKTEGLILCRSGRNTRARRINGVPTECFCVKLPVLEDDDTPQPDFIL